MLENVWSILGISITGSNSNAQAGANGGGFGNISIFNQHWLLGLLWKMCYILGGGGGSGSQAQANSFAVNIGGGGFGGGGGGGGFGIPILGKLNYELIEIVAK